MLQVRRQLNPAVLVRQWKLVASLHLKDVIARQCVLVCRVIVIVVVVVAAAADAVILIRRHNVAEQKDVLYIG